MDCPKCKSTNKIKRGIVKGVQRYSCKQCQYIYTVEKRSSTKSLFVKKQALQLYLEGLGFRAIGRFLGVSNVSVMKWIRSFGEQIQVLRTEKNEIEVVELDEMHSYIGQKKTTVGFGLLLIDLGKNSSTSLLAIEAIKPLKNYGKK